MTASLVLLSAISIKKDSKIRDNWKANDNFVEWQIIVVFEIEINMNWAVSLGVDDNDFACLHIIKIPAKSE